MNIKLLFLEDPMRMFGLNGVITIVPRIYRPDIKIKKIISKSRLISVERHKVLNFDIGSMKNDANIA